MAKRGSRGSTTEAVTVGTTRTGSFGRRVGGVAGREASGGRTGLTDAAVSAGSKAHGRSAPSTGGGGYGGAGGGSGGGVVETTTNPGGISDWTDYSPGGTDPGAVVPQAPPEQWVPEPSVTPVYKNPAPVTIAPTPRTAAPTTTRTTAPTTTRTTAPTTTTAPTSKPFVTPIGGQYAPTPSVTPISKVSGSPTVNASTGFTTSPTMAQRVAALNAQTSPTVNASTGFVTSKPTTAPVVVKGAPAPVVAPTPKPAPTKVATTTRRVAQ